MTWVAMETFTSSTPSYQGQGTNHLSNGLLLRADFHTLFDMGLLAVDHDSMTILVSWRLNGTEYESFHGQRLRVGQAGVYPNREALRLHRDLAGL
jgi:predicted restriction endonuclease